jgi:hypothetical protein
MSTDQRIIDESQLSPDALEPTETFARLVKRVGDQVDLGTLGLDAIRDVVHERIGVTTATGSATSAAKPAASNG